MDVDNWSSQPTAEGIGCFIAGLFALVFILWGSLVVFSKAVLVWEEGHFNTRRFECTYFSGTHIMTRGNDTYTGCRWLIDVGSE